MSVLWPFLLVAVRLSGMMVGAPLFNLKHMPAIAKTGLVLLLTILITPLVAVPPTPPSVFAMGIAVTWELFIGWLVGALTSMASAIALSAGGILDVQMGLANATLLNPGAGEAWMRQIDRAIEERNAHSWIATRVGPHFFNCVPDRF